MSREKELSMIEKLITELYPIAKCGIFNTRNIVGDSIDTIYDGEYFKLDLCYSYSYFEIFGTTYEEFKRLERFYNRLKR